jgi:serine/threonine protein kinase
MIETTLRGRYQIIAKLGQGGFGETYIAKDIDLPGNPKCVVKRLKPQSGDEFTIGTARRLFDSEAEILYLLGNHPQIPQLLAHFQHDQEFYLVQELVEGTSLGDELANSPRWGDRQVIDFLRDTLSTLDFVHQNQVIHRDIKPNNLIRRKLDGKIVLIDFGAVKDIRTLVADAEGNSTFTVAIGTPGFMPYEQQGGKPRYSSDIFALGMTAIQAITGKSPTELDDDPHTGETIWQPHAQLHNQLLVNLLNRMVRSHFRDRYQAAKQVLTDLESINANVAAGTTVVKLNYASDEAEPDKPSAKQPAKPTEPDSTIVFQPGSSVLPTHRQPGRSPATQPISIKRFTPILLIGSTIAAIAFVALLLFRNNATPTAQSNPPAPIATEPEQVEAPTVTIAVNQEVLDKVNRARNLRLSQQPQEALKVYEEVIAIEPEHVDAWWGKCFSLNLLERYDEALNACDRAIEIQPDFAEAWWSKSYAYLQTGNYQEGLDHATKATELKPDFADAWNNRSTALNYLDRYEEGLTAAQQAIELDPNLADAWNNLGFAAEKLGQIDVAVNAYEKAKGLKPGFKEANQNREILRRKFGR